MESTAPRRRSFRLSVKAMMFVVLLLGLGMSGAVRKAHQQRIAVEAVRAYGGWVRYDWEFGTPWGTTGPAAPRWLRRFLGDEYFQEVVCVNLDRNEFADEQVENPNVQPCDD